MTDQHETTRVAIKSDEELLRLAAKGAGVAADENWNPLENDDDALRLAVALRLNVLITPEEGFWAESKQHRVCVSQPYFEEPHEATRRVIVRAAAKIGEKL
jgi:hypothetical protein